MYELDSELVGAVPQSEFGRWARRAPGAALFQCLIMTPVERRGQAWRRAAFEAGWEPVFCRDVKSAVDCATRNRLLLSVIDLQSLPAPTRGRTRQLCEALVGQGAPAEGPLVIVCGDDEDAAEEIWARGLGVWLYLPGVDETCDLTLMCGEARSLAQKLCEKMEDLQTSKRP